MITNDEVDEVDIGNSMDTNLLGEPISSTFAPPISFPIARLKKIIKADKRISTCNNDAATYMAAAAEVFLSELTKKADLICESDKRRTIQYKDIAQAIYEDKRLSPVLSEIVPKTVTLQEAITFQQNLTQQVNDDDPFIKKVVEVNGDDDFITLAVKDPIGITTCDSGNVSIQANNSSNQSSDKEE